MKQILMALFMLFAITSMGQIQLYETYKHKADSTEKIFSRFESGPIDSAVYYVNLWGKYLDTAKHYYIIAVNQRLQELELKMICESMMFKTPDSAEYKKLISIKAKLQ